MLAYHELDPDHMREAVAYKALTQLNEDAPKLCRFIDNERARAASQPHLLDAEHVCVRAAVGSTQLQLSRDSDAHCFFFQPSEYVLDKIMQHVTRVATPAAALPSVDGTVQSAVALGQADHVNFAVAVRVRPPIAREETRRSYTVTRKQLPSGGDGDTAGSEHMGEEITVRTSAGGRELHKEFLFHRVFGEADGNATVYEELARPLLGKL